MALLTTIKNHEHPYRAGGPVKGVIHEDHGL